MSVAKTPKQVLVATKWILENIGWTQGFFTRYRDNKPISFCLYGATNTVIASESIRESATRFLAKALPEDIPHLIQFNDGLTTCKSDVIKLINKAIELCDKEPK